MKFSFLGRWKRTDNIKLSIVYLHGNREKVPQDACFCWNGKEQEGELIFMQGKDKSRICDDDNEEGSFQP